MQSSLTRRVASLVAACCSPRLRVGLPGQWAPNDVSSSYAQQKRLWRRNQRIKKRPVSGALPGFDLSACETDRQVPDWYK